MTLLWARPATIRLRAATQTCRSAAAARRNLLLSVAQSPIDGAEHVGIIVGPHPLVLGGLGFGPLLRGCQLADIGLLARGHHHRGREDIFVIASGILAIDPAP